MRNFIYYILLVILASTTMFLFIIVGDVVFNATDTLGFKGLVAASFLIVINSRKKVFAWFDKATKYKREGK